MKILYILVPISLVLLGAALWSLFWAVDSGQFDNLEDIGRRVPDGDES